uniref:N-acetyltransferase domain-containing protein n=1 Tax=Streptoalloteichus sp. ATCC 53650 TaxID=756733 RepID=K4P176_9PSEU|nr:hypothetical protein [Streptoalloteichus sp. ATCC 53650]
MTTRPARPRARTVKCVVWDLDHTLWDGILLEDGEVTPRPEVVEVIRELDGRGVLHSIASRNDHDAATAALRRFGLLDYFLHPQINWGAKSESVRAVAEALNIGLDALAFVDDDEFERAEVAFAVPEVLCLDARDPGRLTGLSELTPAVVTEDASRRREMYRAEERRREVEERYTGAPAEFLATLDMRLRIAPAREGDLARAHELTVRTNQLNTTGRTYSREQLDRLRLSADHQLLVARLDDRFGPYGTIGLALLETGERVWTVKLLLMSCRVLSRGVGGVLITHLRRLAEEAGVRLRADFVPTDRNRMMRVTYRMNGFREVDRDGDQVVLEARPDDVPPFPPYLRVETSSWREDG